MRGLQKEVKVEEKKKTLTQTKEITISRTTIKEARVKQDLTDNEEYVMRMLHGISEDKNITLERKGENNMETKARLLLLEKALLEQVRGGKLSLPSQSKKQKIIEKLKKI